MIWIHAQIKKILTWRPLPSRTKACIATLLIILVRNNKTKKIIKRGNARQRNIHWTYCTVFTIIQNNITPPHTVRSTLSALYPLKSFFFSFFFFKRQQGTLLSCQLMINGSAAHLHHHQPRFPWTNRPHIVSLLKKKRQRWPLLGRHCVDVSLRLPRL